MYRNPSPSGSIYYRVATVAIATTTYDDSSTDATISANDTYETDNNVAAVNTYGIVDAHKSRALMLGPYDWDGGTAYDHSVAWSKTNEPWSWPTLNTMKVEPGRYGLVRGARPPATDTSSTKTTQSSSGTGTQTRPALPAMALAKPSTRSVEP